MKARYSNVCRVLIIISFFIMVGGYYLFPRDFIGEYNIRLIVALVGCFLAVTVRFRFPKEDKKKIRQIDLIVALIIATVMFEMYLSKRNYGYSLRDTVINVIPYFYVMYVYPILYIFKRDRSLFALVEVLAVIELCMLGIRFLSFYYFNYKDVVLFPRLLFQYNVWLRNGYQRIEAGVFLGVALIFWTVKGIEGYKNSKIFSWCVIAFMVFFLAFVTKVRFQTAISLLTVLIVVYFIKMRLTKNSFLVKFYSIIAILVFLYVSGAFRIVYNLVSVNGSFGAQTAVRLLGIEHYLRLLKGKSLLFGLGILDSNYTAAHAYMIRDQWSIFHLDDLGIVGGIAQFGLLSVALYLPLFFYAIHTCRVCRKKKNELFFGISLGICVYMIGSCFLLNIYDPQRAFDIPFYLSILAFLNMYPGYRDNVNHFKGKYKIKW